MAAVLLVAFVAVEALQREPMFDLSLFKKPTFVGGLIAAFAISASLFSAFPYLVLYMQTGLGLSAIEVGVRFLVLSGPIFITAALAGRLSDRVPPRPLTGFVDGLNAILLVGAVLALVAAATSLALIRRRDFVRTSPAEVGSQRHVAAASPAA